MEEIKRIYEDEYIVVCIKPAGVQSEDGKQPGMPSILCENGKKPYVVHRLDKEVGGLMVFAKSKSVAASLSAQIQSGNFKKEYLSVVEGVIEENGRYEDLLFHDKNRNKTYVVNRERKGVKKAVLEFNRLSTVSHKETNLSLVRIKLETGRTHQIRVQFGSRKHPVFGDRKYGSKGTDYFSLFSCYLRFIHPVNNSYLEYEFKPFEQYPWNLFENDM